MRALVSLVRPFRVLLWVVGLGYVVWLLSAAMSTLAGAPGAYSLGDLVFGWFVIPAFAWFFLDRALAELDPYTAKVRQAKKAAKEK